MIVQPRSRERMNQVSMRERTKRTRQYGLPDSTFVGHVGEDCVYMMEEVRGYKTNRDWHLDSSSSNNTMSDDEDNKPISVNHLDNHNNNNNQNNNKNNNEGFNLNDFVDTEDYEPTDPDGFDQQIIDMFGSSHDDLLSTTATAVGTIMS
jgi:hypothetical protein